MLLVSAQVLFQKIDGNGKNALHTMGVLRGHRRHCSGRKSALHGAALQICLEPSTTSTV